MSIAAAIAKSMSTCSSVHSNSWITSPLNGIWCEMCKNWCLSNFSLWTVYDHTHTKGAKIKSKPNKIQEKNVYQIPIVRHERCNLYLSCQFICTHADLNCMISLKGINSSKINQTTSGSKKKEKKRFNLLKWSTEMHYIKLNFDLNILVSNNTKGDDNFSEFSVISS